MMKAIQDQIDFILLPYVISLENMPPSTNQMKNNPQQVVTWNFELPRVCFFPFEFSVAS